MQPEILEMIDYSKLVSNSSFYQNLVLLFVYRGYMGSYPGLQLAHTRLAEHCAFAGFPLPSPLEAASALQELQAFLSGSSSAKVKLTSSDSGALPAGDEESFRSGTGVAAWGLPSADYLTYGTGAGGAPVDSDVARGRKSHPVKPKGVGADASLQLLRSSGDDNRSMLLEPARNVPAHCGAVLLEQEPELAGCDAGVAVEELDDGVPAAAAQSWLAARDTVRKLLAAGLFK